MNGNSRYDTVMFDLDGTITDSAPGILASVRHAVRRWYAERGERNVERDDDALNFFIGPPLYDSFRKLLGCDDEDARNCIRWYREFYTAEVNPGMLMNRVYDGVEETLKALKALGLKICLATAKPEIFARRILDHFRLSGYFDHIHGATLEEGRNRKAQVIEWALGHSGEVGRAIMVGDRADDVKGAAANGLETIGALWGYGGEAELREAGARIFCNNIHELITIIER